MDSFSKIKLNKFLMENKIILNSQSTDLTMYS